MSSLSFASDSNHGYDIKNGHKSGHKILVYKNGIQKYFKPRHSCELLVPITTSFLGEFLGLDIIPAVSFYKLKGKSGSIRTYFPEALSLEERKGIYLKHMSLETLASLDIVNFLSGSYDSHRGNYLFIKELKKILSIDHDGPALQFGRYGDFRFLPLLENDISKCINEFDFSSERKISESELRGLIKKRFPDLEKGLVEQRLERPDRDGKFWIVETKGNIWVKDVNRNRVPPHQLRISSRVIKKISGLRHSQLVKKLGNLKECYKLNNYIEVFFKKRDQFLKRVKTDPLFSIY